MIVKPINETHSKVSGQCRVTRKLYSVVVDNADLERYYEGALVQNAFCGLSVADREFLISEISPEGWEMLFGGPNDD